MVRDPWNYLFKRAGKKSSPSSLVINQKSATNQQKIAEHFNNFFTSIGENIQEIISPARKDYAQYLKTPNKSNFSIKTIKPEEICDIKTLKIVKLQVPIAFLQRFLR